MASCDRRGGESEKFIEFQITQFFLIDFMNLSNPQNEHDGIQPYLRHKRGMRVNFKVVFLQCLDRTHAATKQVLAGCSELLMDSPSLDSSRESSSSSS